MLDGVRDHRGAFVIDAVERLQTRQARSIFNFELLEQPVLSPIQTDDVFEGLERIFIELGQHQGLEHFEKGRRAMDGGGIQAFENGAQVGIVLQKRARMLHAFSQHGFDRFGGLIHRRRYRDDFVDDLAEKLRAARESFSRFGLAALPDEVGQWDDDLVHDTAVERRKFLVRGLRAHLELNDLAEKAPESLVEYLVAVAVLRRDEAAPNEIGVQPNLASRARQKHHLDRAKEFVQRVPAVQPIFGDPLHQRLRVAGLERERLRRSRESQNLDLLEKMLTEDVVSILSKLCDEAIGTREQRRGVGVVSKL